WMVALGAGTAPPHRLTFSKDTEQTPKFSPDDRWIAFLSNRGTECETDQLWLLSRAGGEAEKLTDFRGGVTDYIWSPDARKIAIIAKDPDPECSLDEKSKKKTRKPIVIDRYQFK